MKFTIAALILAQAFASSDDQQNTTFEANGVDEQAYQARMLYGYPQPIYGGCYPPPCAQPWSPCGQVAPCGQQWPQYYRQKVEQDLLQLRSMNRTLAQFEKLTEESILEETEEIDKLDKQVAGVAKKAAFAYPELKKKAMEGIDQQQQDVLNVLIKGFTILRNRIRMTDTSDTEPKYSIETRRLRRRLTLYLKRLEKSIDEGADAEAMKKLLADIEKDFARWQKNLPEDKEEEQDAAAAPAVEAPAS